MKQTSDLQQLKLLLLYRPTGCPIGVTVTRLDVGGKDYLDALTDSLGPVHSGIIECCDFKVLCNSIEIVRKPRTAMDFSSFYALLSQLIMSLSRYNKDCFLVITN